MLSCALLLKTVMDKFFSRKYKLETSENFEEFMKAIGVGLVVRKMGNAVSPVVQLYKEGDDYVWTSVSTFKHVLTRFKPGVEMDDVTPDGRNIRTKFTFSGNTMLEEQVYTNGKKVTIERIFSEDQLKMVLKVDNIVCIRVYKYLPG